VEGAFPRERQAEEGEEESVKAQRDKEFADALKKKDEKLSKEQAFGKWTYKVSSWTLDSVLKKRSELLKEMTEESAGSDEPEPLPDFGVPQME
jgi:hypothetical protein